MIRKQSGVIPCFFDANGIKVMLINPRVTTKAWIFPKGNIEKCLTPMESAAKEAYEEAGITGQLFPQPVGTYHYEKFGNTYHVTLYLIVVEHILEKYPEKNHRQRTLVSFDQARGLLQNTELWTLLEQAGRMAQQIPRGGGNQ